MKKFWSVLLAVGTWGLGHAPAIAQIAIDAKTKNIPKAIEEGLALAATVPPSK